MIKMEQESILLAILFKRKPINVKECVHFFDGKLLEIFNAEFDDVSYSVLEGSKLKSKSYRYSSKNLEKLYGESSLLSLELLHLLPHWEHKSKDIKLSVLYSVNFSNSDSLILITISKEEFFLRYDRNDLKRLYLSLLSFFDGQGLDPDYGFAFSFPRQKFPTMYATGIGSEKLSKSEEVSMQRWAEGLNKCDRGIWDIFWLNFVKKDHFKSPNDWERVHDLVGEENFSQLNSKDFVFTLGDFDLLYNPDGRSLPNRLRDFFNFV